jgi:hypothetical protein
MAKSDKLYSKSPKLERDEETGKVKVKAAEAQEEAGAEGQDGSDAEMGAMDEDAGERREMHMRHSHEHMMMHHRHEMEHDKSKGSKEEVHKRHHEELKQMHKRHEDEMKQMHKRHEERQTKPEKKDEKE